MGVYIFGALFVIVLLGSLIYAYLQLQRYIGWHQFRSEHGMSYTGFGFLMDFGFEGTYRGHSVQIWLEREPGFLEQLFDSSDDDDFGEERERWWTYYRAELPESVPRHLGVYEEGMLGDVAEMVGAQDVEIDREVFDEYLTVKAADEEAARTYLSRPEVADAILDLRNAFKDGFAIDKGVARVYHDGMADVAADANADDDSEIEVQGSMEAAFDGVHEMPSYRLEERLETLIECVEKLEAIESSDGAD